MCLQLLAISVALICTTVEGKSLDMLFDTGADATLVSQVLYNDCLSHLPLEKCRQKLSTFTWEQIPTVGQVHVKVKCEPQSATLPLVIVKGERPAFLVYYLREPVVKELNRLEALGVISETDRSEWALPVVVVPKVDKSI